MPETRMLPKATPRSTGIERTNVQGGTRQQAAGTGSSSHVSAAPGAGARVHEHVVNARNPAGAAQRPPAQGAQTKAQAPNGGVSVTRGRQDAKVQLINRSSGGAAGFDRPTVQLMDASQAAELARPGSRVGSPARSSGFDARGAFNADQLTLMGSLLGQYKERLEAIPGDSNAATIGMCGDALERIAYLLKGGTFAPAAATAAAPTAGPAKIDEGSDAEGEPSGDPDGQG